MPQITYRITILQGIDIQGQTDIQKYAGRVERFASVVQFDIDQHLAAVPFLAQLTTESYKSEVGCINPSASATGYIGVYFRRGAYNINGCIQVRR